MDSVLSCFKLIILPDFEVSLSHIHNKFGAPHHDHNLCMNDSAAQRNMSRRVKHTPLLAAEDDKKPGAWMCARTHGECVDICDTLSQQMYVISFKRVERGGGGGGRQRGEERRKKNERMKESFRI